VAGVVHDGKVVYRRAFGLASVELGVANTVTTRMRIGSTSKHFTCLAALLLAEDGLLDIDAGIRTYVPEIAPLADPTLRQLMSHTGGLRDYLDASFLASGMAIRPNGSALAMQVRQRDVNFPAGERMIYCNGGYHLLSLAIERVAGMPFEKVLTARIFEPLGMLDTESAPSDLTMRERQASLHVPLPSGGYRKGVFPSEEIRGEGAIVSSLDDMLRWVAHLRGPKQIGNAETWSQLFERAILTNGRVQPYALGLMFTTYRGIETIHHGGTVIGGRCQMLTVPSRALDIVIITNGGPAAPGELAKRVLDVVLGDGELAAPETRPKTAAYASLVGARYHAPASGLVVEFADAAETLGLRLIGNEPIPLHAEGNRLSLAFDDIAMGPFEIDLPEGELPVEAPAELTIAEGGNGERYVRLPDADIADDPALVGAYACTDLGEPAAIALDGEDLVLRIGGTFGTALELRALVPDFYIWTMRDDLSPIRGVLNVDRTDGGAIAGFRIDTPRTRRLVFTRS
jgi:CubicO group peptidase (beta-lactamase class C family)